MRYHDRTGAVELELAELCALAFGRGNYKDEPSAECDMDALATKSGAYYTDVMLQHTCRFAGVLINT